MSDLRQQLRSLARLRRIVARPRPRIEPHAIELTKANAQVLQQLYPGWTPERFRGLHESSGAPLGILGKGAGKRYFVHVPQFDRWLAEHVKQRA